MVTGPVSLWYQDHSTTNPLGVKPDSKITSIVAGDKFTGESLEIISTLDNVATANDLDDVGDDGDTVETQSEAIVPSNGKTLDVPIPIYS